MKPSNIEPLAREMAENICRRSGMSEADIPRWVDLHWSCAAAMLEAGVMDEGGDFLILLVGMVAGFLRLDGKRGAMRFLIVAVVSGYLVSLGLKAYYDRPRPQIVAIPGAKRIDNAPSICAAHRVDQPLC